LSFQKGYNLWFCKEQLKLYILNYRSDSIDFMRNLVGASYFCFKESKDWSGSSEITLYSASSHVPRSRSLQRREQKGKNLTLWEFFSRSGLMGLWQIGHLCFILRYQSSFFVVRVYNWLSQLLNLFLYRLFFIVFVFGGFGCLFRDEPLFEHTGIFDAVSCPWLSFESGF